MSSSKQSLFRRIPAIEALLRDPELVRSAVGVPRKLVVDRTGLEVRYPFRTRRIDYGDVEMIDVVESSVHGMTHANVLIQQNQVTLATGV